MSLYSNRIQAPTKTLSAEWIPEDGELFRDSSGNLYMGDNVTPSNELDPIGGTATPAGASSGIMYRYDASAINDIDNVSVLRMNSTTAASVTTISVGPMDLTSTDQSALLDLFTSGIMHLNKDDGLRVSFKVNRMIDKTDVEGYYEFTVEHIVGTLPADLSVVRFETNMDAPGVRKLVATVDPFNVSFSVSKNTFEGDPVFTVDTGYLKVEIPGSSVFSRVTSGYGSCSDTNSSDVIGLNMQTADTDIVHFHWPLSLSYDPGFGFITLTCELQ